MGRLAPNLNIITPNCLKVDKAMIFFISVSNMATVPAINIVVAPIRRRDFNTMGCDLIKLKNRKTKNTPAVTRVEEWTRADTGVGAAMAAGSHLLNGICALLVQAAILRRKARVRLDGLVFIIIQCPWFTHNAILRRIKTSPIRLVKAVMIPAARDLGFW